MMTIRTGLVALAFAAMGLTSAAEYLAERLAEHESPASVNAEAAELKMLQLTQKWPTVGAAMLRAPWI